MAFKEVSKDEFLNFANTHKDLVAFDTCNFEIPGQGLYEFRESDKHYILLAHAQFASRISSRRKDYYSIREDLCGTR